MPAEIVPPMDERSESCDQYGFPYARALPMVAMVGTDAALSTQIDALETFMHFVLLGPAVAVRSRSIVH